MAERLIEARGLALVPGPVEISQPLFSFEVYDDLVSHAPEKVAAVLLAIPGVRRTGDEEPVSGCWTARWEHGDRYLDIDFTLMEQGDDPPLWGGSHIEGRCAKSDLMRIWSAVREQLDGVWLHDSTCRLYTPQAFARKKLT